MGTACKVLPFGYLSIKLAFDAFSFFLNQAGGLVSMGVMRMLNHILLVVVLLVALFPCAHALTHHDHHDLNILMCGIAAESCSCHSPDEQPCTDQVEIQFDRIANAVAVMEPTYSPAFQIYTATASPCRKTVMHIPGILASLQTVQLLI